MKINRKIVLGTVVSLVVAGSVAAGAASNFHLKVNGEAKSAENIKVIDGKSYLPVAEIAQHLGASVGWDAKTKTVSLNKSAGSGGPALDVLAVQKGNDIDFTLNVSNFKMSAENYGKADVPGEGHAHIYLDGERVAGVKEAKYTLSDVPVGKHTVDVTLQANDHKDLGVKKTFEIEVMPTLDVTLKQEGNKAIINFSTNLKLSAENYGKDPVVGEGHTHVYLDGEKVTGLKTADPYTLENIPSGKHKIKVDLQQNNHKPIGIEKEFEIEVK